MERLFVRDFMSPLDGFVAVSEDDSLYDAVIAMEEAYDKYGETRYQRRAVLVYGEKAKVVGKVSQLDILRALEPKYEDIGESTSMTRFGFSPRFLKAMLSQFELWKRPLDELCRGAVKLKVKDFMYTLTKGEYIQEDAPLSEAIHLLVAGHHQSLLVTGDSEIVGILRLVDLFKAVCQRIKACADEKA